MPHRARRQSRLQRQFRRHALDVYPFCQWCQQPLTPETATTDHLVPLSRGGGNDWHNLCLACFPCNQARNNHLPVRPPTGPRWGDPTESLPVWDETVWVVWTRYPGGRWRATFRGANQEALLHDAAVLVGDCGECVVLADGTAPDGW